MSPLDPQTERFYAFERAARMRFEPRVPIPMRLSRCEDLVRLVLRRVGSAQPTDSIRVTGEWRRGGGRCRSHGDGTFTLDFPPLRRRPWCVLHEAAHVLVADERSAGGHGPRFATVCIGLWTSFGGWPQLEVLRLAATFGVERWPEEEFMLAIHGGWVVWL